MYEHIQESKTKTWLYEYSDELDNLVKTIRPDGNQISYLYYGSGHLHGMLLNQESIVDIERNNIHGEVKRAYGNHIERELTFDEGGRLTAMDLRGTHENSKTYQYNRAGLIESIMDSDAGLQRYQYDVVDRLIASESPLAKEKFTFDDSDNLLNPQTAHLYRERQQKRRLQHVVEESIVEGNNLLTDFNHHRYEYDERGNLIKKITGNQTIEYSWNQFNQLLTLKTDKHLTHYRYDSFGRRIAKFVIHSPKPNQDIGQVDETYYWWEGDTMVMEESNGKIKHYVYELGSFEPLLQFTGKPNADNFKQVNYYHNDHIGTPQAMTNHEGDVVWQGKHLAFGQLFVDKQSRIDNPIRFQGQYYDEESGLHYNRHHYYDPETAKYLSEDPIKLAGGMNLYDYPENPVMVGDALGLQKTNSVTDQAEEIVKYISKNRKNIAKWLRFTTGPFGIVAGEALGADFLTCTAGALGASAGFSINLHSQEVFPEVSKGTLLSDVYSQRKTTKFSLKKAGSASCVLGTIYNMNPAKTDAENTNLFLLGVSGTVQGGLYGVNLGWSHSFQSGTGYNRNARLVGVGTPGIDFELGFTPDVR